jgi:hypothetical protein
MALPHGACISSCEFDHHTRGSTTVPKTMCFVGKSFGWDLVTTVYYASLPTKYLGAPHITNAYVTSHIPSTPNGILDRKHYVLSQPRFHQGP